MNEQNSAMIEAEGLVKRFGTFTAVDNVGFSVPKGQITAFLGPNGAGKTTTMRLLTGFLTPTAGRVRIAGFDVATQRLEAAAKVGYLPENGPLYPDMTPHSLLKFFGQARGLSEAKLKERIDVLTGICGLGRILHKPIYKLSKGNRQRVGLAQSMLHEPEVLIMDEPTSGLDPNQILDARKAIREVGRQRTVLLSTHILQEVEAVADRVLLIHRGRIVFDGKPAEMKKGGSAEEFFRSMTQEGKESAA